MSHLFAYTPGAKSYRHSPLNICSDSFKNNLSYKVGEATPFSTLHRKILVTSHPVVDSGAATRVQLPAAFNFKVQLKNGTLKQSETPAVVSTLNFFLFFKSHVRALKHYLPLSVDLLLKCLHGISLSLMMCSIIWDVPTTYLIRTRSCFQWLAYLNNNLFYFYLTLQHLADCDVRFSTVQLCLIVLLQKTLFIIEDLWDFGNLERFLFGS